MTANNPDDTFEEFDARYLLREPWRDWTPAVDQNGAVAATITYARYIVLARTVILTCFLAITGTGVAANDIIVSGIPFDLPTTSTFAYLGNALITDITVAAYTATVTGDTATSVKFREAATGGFIGTSPSFALTSGDFISFTMSYER